jgi:hypothetical protein
MAGLDPATQPARVRATERPSFRKDFSGVLIEFPARTDVRALGGRVKPGHDDYLRDVASRSFPSHASRRNMHDVPQCLEDLDGTLRG